MESCRYHPTVAAGWHCRHCARDFCDDCIAQGPQNRYQTTCILCDEPLDSLGGAGDAEPFWRRLEASFRYPLTLDAGGLIIGGAILGTVAIYLPPIFAVLLSLFVAGVVVRYSFNCLKSTAQGRLVAPDIVESYGGGIALLFKLFVMLMAVSLLIGLAVAFLGPALGGLIALVVLVLVPAMIMLFAAQDSLRAGLDLRAAWRLVGAIGTPYGVLLGLMLVMMTSIAVIEELLGSTGFIALTLQSAASNYYTIVMFHIMGYVLFQYQRELGYVAERDDGSSQTPKSERELIDARIAVFVKEGRYEDALKVFSAAVKRFPEDRALGRKCLDFLLATRQEKLLDDYASAFFERALKQRDPAPLAPDYHAVRRVLPGYMPDTAELRVALARELQHRGESKHAVQLLNGLHKVFPKYGGLPEAYGLMAEVLESMPKMAPQAEKYRAFAAKLAT
ncbi:MAG: hypothetical protein V2J24_15860 [Pseudomonadales bacterium]|nr:hypothetical protein [Pseudomonadales bacterium]